MTLREYLHFDFAHFFVIAEGAVELSVEGNDRFSLRRRLSARLFLSHRECESPKNEINWRRVKSCLDDSLNETDIDQMRNTATVGLNKYSS